MRSSNGQTDRMTTPSPCDSGPPDDPIATAVAAAISDVVAGSTVAVSYSAEDGAAAPNRCPAGSETASDSGPPGWRMTITVRPDEQAAMLPDRDARRSLRELLTSLPGAGVRAAARLRPQTTPAPGRIDASLGRACRDAVAAEILADYLASRVGGTTQTDLISETIDYLIELSGTRVEAHPLTHGAIIADFLEDTPTLEFRYPDDLRSAKRAPLLFDGQRSVLVVDPRGRARTEMQWHRLDRWSTDPKRVAMSAQHSFDGGLLVAEATRRLGGVGFFVRADRSIWTFVDGQPLLVRQREHWTAFPLQLSTSIADMIGSREVAALVARTAFIISAQPSGAILAVVDDPDRLADVVPAKDRYDLRGDLEPEEMRPEARLHHLIDAAELDEHTLARLATLDGATVLDHNGGLISYGAIVTSTDSEHEGARTAAARSLSEVADVVLKVSVDGDITIFSEGAVVTRLLGPSRR